MAKVTLITGLTGQDGAYLAELLLSKGYEVNGTKLRSSLFNTDRIDYRYQDPHSEDRNLSLHYGDSSYGCILGAQSHVAVSFQQPEYTANVDGLRGLEDSRDHTNTRS